MKVEINITKGKFWFLTSLLVLIIGVLVFAATGTKPNPGHSADEVEGLTVLMQRVDTLEKIIWPPGEYCILQAGKKCPVGFESGEICVDSMDSDVGPYNPGNNDRRTGKYGDSGGPACGKSSVQFLLCCK